MGHRPDAAAKGGFVGSELLPESHKKYWERCYAELDNIGSGSIYIFLTSAS